MISIVLLTLLTITQLVRQVFPQNALSLNSTLQTRRESELSTARVLILLVTPVAA